MNSCLLIYQLATTICTVQRNIICTYCMSILSDAGKHLEQPYSCDKACMDVVNSWIGVCVQVALPPQDSLLWSFNAQVSRSVLDFQPWGSCTASQSVRILLCGPYIYSHGISCSEFHYWAGRECKIWRRYSLLRWANFCSLYTVWVGEQRCQRHVKWHNSM